MHLSSVIAASVPDWLKVLKDVLEEKQPRYENPSMVSGFCVDAMLCVGEGVEVDVDVSVVAILGLLELAGADTELAETETAILVVVAEDAAAVDSTAAGTLEEMLLMGPPVTLCETAVVMEDATDVRSAARSTAVLYTSM